MSSTGAGTTRQQVSFAAGQLAEKFLSERQAAGASPLTLRAYKRILKDLKVFLQQETGEDDIRHAGKEQIRKYATHVCSVPVKQQQKQIWIGRLCVFFRWLTQTRVILADPTASLSVAAAKDKTLPRYLTQSEVAILLDSIPVDSDEGLRDRALMEVLYSCGLRAGEIRRLTLADINFADGSARILMSKGKKDRVVPVGATALYWLDRYIQQVHGYRLSGPLFYHFRTRTPLANNVLTEILEKYRIAAGIKKRCPPRIFRHSFAVHLLENGASIRHIQAMLGHCDLKTTQKYTHIIPAELKRAHIAAHPSENRKWKLPQAHPIRFGQRRKGVK